MLNAISLKKSLLAFSLFTYVSCEAQAEPSASLVIYGRIVNGINYQSNQNTGRVDASGNAVAAGGWSLDGNVWGTSLLGFSGREKLSDELQAIFVLENGFDASTGRVSGGPSLWTRRALIGLSGPAGTLKLGRSLSLPTEQMWRVDPSGEQAMGIATLVKGRNWPTYDNQIDYTTPVYKGMSAQMVYGLGEIPGSMKRGSSGGIALTYAQASYELLAMYDFARDQNGSYASLFQYSRQYTIGSAFYIGKVKLLTGYQRLSASTSTVGPNQARHAWVGANYWITPATMLLGGLYHIRMNRNGGAARLYMLGANHYLSKQTLLYASAGTLRNAQATNFAIQTYNGGPAQDGVVGAKQASFYAGISYSF